jgi:hypothetical protein
MSDAPETEWTVVACALIAHADGILEGAECDRLLAMIDEELGDQDYGDWLTLISDPEGLQTHLESLPLPPQDSHREVLERAWAMAMVDGEQCEAEVRVLAELGGRLGLEPVQLDFWREAWTAAAREFSEWSAQSAAQILGGDAPIFADDRTSFLDLIEMLPTTREHREELRTMIAVSDKSAEEVGRALSAMPAGKRRRLLRLVAPLAVESAQPEAARGRFVQLCGNAGVMVGDAQGLLAAAENRRSL